MNDKASKKAAMKAAKNNSETNTQTTNNMSTQLQPISDIATSGQPLPLLLQACNNRNKYNPLTQFAAWVHCMNEVMAGQG